MKKEWVKIFLFGLFLTDIFSCGPKPELNNYFSSIDLLRKELDQIYSDPAFDTATWGVVVQSLQTGEYLYRRNSHKGFMPASNMKLYTTAAALGKLGPDYRYKTVLLTNGNSEDGVLEGDLIIRGSGDPSITGRYHEDDPLAPFYDWVDSLKSIGISRINGRIIGDDNYFEDEIMGYGWSWDYQSNYYAAQISALSFNDNCVDICFTPAGNLGEAAQFQLRPNTKYVHVFNQVKTVRPGLNRGIRFNRKRAFNDIIIRGSLVLNSKPRWNWFSVENPTLYTAFVFQELLEQEGILVTGKACDIDSLADFYYEPDSSIVLASYYSPSLIEIVTTINKNSQNLYAELLLRTLGKQFTDVGDGRHGVQVVKEVLSGFGADSSKFGMVDGSGLSRMNLVTPMQTSILLRAVKNSPVGDLFYSSLPIAGVDGTIRNRMKNTAAENNVRAKTGTISRAKALSGYVTTKDGELLSFVMMVNNYTVPTAKANFVQDWVCERLANFQRKLPFR